MAVNKIGINPKGGENPFRIYSNFIYLFFNFLKGIPVFRIFPLRLILFLFFFLNKKQQKKPATLKQNSKMFASCTIIMYYFKKFFSFFFFQLKELPLLHKQDLVLSLIAWQVYDFKF